METETLKTTRHHFSKLGLMYLLGTLIILVVQNLIYFLVDTFLPQLFESYTSYFLIMMLSMYAIGIPLMALLVRTVPKEPVPEKKKMTVGQWLIAFVICYAAMYIANIIGNIITSIIGVIKGSAVSNDIISVATSNSIWANVLVMVILAPIIEELIFRKLLIDRTAKYGEGISVFLSALLFGLFHGNLNQFAYAFVIGGIFAFIYVKTRNIKYSILMHMLINFMGSIVSLALLKVSGLTELMTATEAAPEEIMAITMNHIPGIMMFMLYALVIVGLVIAGIVLFFVNLKKIHFAKTEYTVPKGKRFVTYFVNVGMLAFIIFWIVRIIFQLFS